MQRGFVTCVASLVFVALAASATAAGNSVAIDGQTFTVPQPPPPPAGAAAPQRVGTAVVRGHVVAADNGQPLRKAQVRLMGTDAANGRQVENRVATTDVDGRYEFTDLLAGQYMLTASRGNYVSLMYGQQRQNEAGKPLQVLGGQTVERVDFSLPRGAVLTGRILDEYGEPMSNLQVAAVRSQVMNGQRRLMPSGRMASTDDLGEFRLFGVPPGQYYVQATWRSMMPAPIPGATADDRTGYAPTFFPGVIDPTRGQRITVGIGDTINDLSFAMLPIRTSTITGTVADSNGRPMRGVLMVMQDGGFMSTGAQIRPDGTFTVPNLPPGEYTLRAQPMGVAGPNPDVAMMKINATGEDITDLHLVGAKPSTASGRIVIDPAASASPPRVMLAATLIDGGPMFMNGGGPGRMSDDGTFALSVQPGRNRITLTNSGGGWAIRAVRLNGVDVTDTGIEVKPNEIIDRLEVELTNRLTTVSGLVTNARGEPAKSYSAIVFPQERERWTGNPRYQGTARPDQDGRFRVSGLPPGNYYIVAVERIEPGQAQDPDFFEAVLPKATAFSLNEAETRVIDLRLTSPQ